MTKADRPTKPKNLPPFIVLVGIALLVGAVFLLKSGNDIPSSEMSLENQLNQALQKSQPVFVFLHSLDCIPCQEMMEVVAQVYPEFEEDVVLIDVDVYHPGNENILRREGLQYIPTLVFYNRKGERYLQIGVLPPEQLRTTLQALGEDN